MVLSLAGGGNVQPSASPAATYSTNLVQFAPACTDPNSLPSNSGEAIALANRITAYRDDLALAVAANEKTLQAMGEISQLEARQQVAYSRYAVIDASAKAAQQQTIDHRQQAIQRLQAGILEAMKRA